MMLGKIPTKLGIWFTMNFLIASKLIEILDFEIEFHHNYRHAHITKKKKKSHCQVIYLLAFELLT